MVKCRQVNKFSQKKNDFPKKNPTFYHFRRLFRNIRTFEIISAKDLNPPAYFFLFKKLKKKNLQKTFSPLEPEKQPRQKLKIEKLA